MAVEEFHGVADIDGEGLGLGVERLGFLALGVGVGLGGGGEVALELEVVLELLHVEGAGQGHGGAGMLGRAVVFALDDGEGGFIDEVVGGEVGDGGGADVAPVKGAVAGVENPAQDAEVEDLMKVGDGQGEPGGLLGQGGGMGWFGDKSRPRRSTRSARPPCMGG